MSYRLLLCTSWFRPQMGRDMGIELLDRLQTRDLNLVGVIGPEEEVLAQACQSRGVPYFPLPPAFRLPSSTLRKRLAEASGFAEELDRWMEPIRALGADLGVLYFATWIPPQLLQATGRGWVNFHPAPLPQLRGFLPEDFALLWGWKALRGTLHVATDAIDEGPIIRYGPYARLSAWDTPDSAMQKVGETVSSFLASAVTKYLDGKAKLTEQASVPGFYAGYAEFYPESYLDWQGDDHAQMLRRFQTFLGQAHRVVLKAKFPDETWEVTFLETLKLNLSPPPGTVLGELEGFRVVRTRQGVAIVGGHPLVRDAGLSAHLDRQVQHTIAPGKRPPRFTLGHLKPLLARWRS